MTLTNYDRRSGTESTNVHEWRRDCFLEMGCDLKLADLLAEMAPSITKTGIDLHDFKRLIDDGCEPTVAARILLPDDYALF